MSKGIRITSWSAVQNKRKSMAKREPNGRIQRVHMPDRGTDELRAKRKKVTGEDKLPIDLSDPIDCLHRGQIKHLENDQALAAHLWRSHREVIVKEGPRLAEMRDPTGPGSDVPAERIRRAKDALDRIDRRLQLCGIAIREECIRVVIDRARPQRLADLKTGLSACAQEMGLM